MPLIDENGVVINAIVLTDQASDPTAPTSGHKLYTKANGVYTVDSSSAVVGPITSGFANPMTTAGDLILGGVSGAAGRLAIGSNTYILTSNGTTAAWAAAAAAGLGADGWGAADALTYASADAPTYTVTCAGDQTGKYSAGMRLKLTDSTVKYFIITVVTYGAPNTTLTIYGGTDYTLSGGAITNPYYSSAKAPLGMPLDPAKWSVKVTDTSQLTQATPTASTWYNLGSLTISVPIGVWHLSYQLSFQGSRGTNALQQGSTTLSTANNSASDAEFTAASIIENGYTLGFTPRRDKVIALTSKTAYYLNAMTPTSGQTGLNFRGDYGTTVIQAICAYL